MTSDTSLRVTATLLALAYGAAVFIPSLPHAAHTGAEVADRAQGSQAAFVVAGGYLYTIAGIAAIVFAHLLAGAMPARGARARDVVRGAGTGYGLALLLAAVLFTAVPMGVAVGELPGPLPVETYRVLTQAGFFALLIPGLLCAGTAMMATWVALRHSTATPRWVGAVGLGCAPLTLLGFAWAPQFLVPLWALAVAFGLRSEVPEPGRGDVSRERASGADARRTVG
jgi:hypothetical protein